MQDKLSKEDTAKLKKLLEDNGYWYLYEMYFPEEFKAMKKTKMTSYLKNRVARDKAFIKKFDRAT